MNDILRKYNPMPIDNIGGEDENTIKVKVKVDEGEYNTYYFKVSNVLEGDDIKEFKDSIKSEYYPNSDGVYIEVYQSIKE